MSAPVVTQADREAAWKVWRSLNGVWQPWMAASKASFLGGDWDTEEIVQAFARHRHQSTAPLQGWREAVECALLVWMRTADEFETPREAVQWLIEWEQSVALDPKVSERAKALMGNAAPLIEAMKAAQESGEALLSACKQMIADTLPMLAEMQMRGRGPYTGKQIGDEMAALAVAHAKLTAEIKAAKGNE